MYLLTIESTCDETAAAVLNEQLDIRGEVVASQESLHERYHGVVPEIAARAHVEQILPVIDEALRRANLGLKDLTRRRRRQHARVGRLAVGGGSGRQDPRHGTPHTLDWH